MMIKKIDQTDRRVLKFPAIHPCERISPTTLLASLITFSHNICNYRSKLFAAQRRNARKTIRQVANLRIFFEEIRDRGLNLSGSVVLCFSELHLTFQKIHFLLEDCTREGARLWILMKFQFVASQFRVLIRAIATALDVLPLNSIDVAAEVKEVVELVAKQARRAKLEIDPDDESMAKQVQSILNRLEKGIEPELSVVKRVLDYLEIRSWNECNKEIKFLDQEIGLECLECYEREAPFLSSLMGFMSYCRAVVFETLDYQNTDQTDTKNNVKLLSCLNPEDFRCPISLGLMTDPVTVSTGQTYDRSSIEKWLNSGNTICPKTGETLLNSELVPNYALRKVMHRFCAENGVSLDKSGRQNRDMLRTVVAGSLAAAEAMNFLAEFLASRLAFGTGEQKNKAAYEVRLLAKWSIFNRSVLIEAGTIPSLLNLLSSPDASTQENAIAALLKLSKQSKGKKKIIRNRGLSSIVEVIQNGLKLEARQIAAATLFYLSSVEEYRKLIGETPEAIPALLHLIKDGTAYGKKNAVVAIFGLLLHPGNHQKVLEAGTVPLLIDLLSSSSTSNKADLVADTLAILASLSSNFEGTLAILQTNALPLIRGILNSSSSSSSSASSSSGVGKEYCVSILLSSCINGGVEVIADLARDSSLPASLYCLLTEGTSHAGKKARSLLKILHRHSETRSSRLTSAANFQEQFVHVR